MNTAHWHLLLNHFPIIGTVIGTLVLIAGYVLKNNTVIKQTALVILFFSALMAIPAYLTGEGAEELIEKAPGVTENVIETHEELGEIFFIVVLILGALSILTLLLSILKNKMLSFFYIVVLATSIGTCVFAKQVGTSGGEIRHTEIRNRNINQGNASEPNNVGENDDD